MKKIFEYKNTSVIASSEEELFFIRLSQHSCVNLENDESTWVVNLGASFHLNCKRECFSSYIAGDYDYVKMGNDGECKMVSLEVCVC